MLGKISLILVLLTSYIVAGDRTETTAFWVEKLGRNVTWRSWAGIIINHLRL